MKRNGFRPPAFLLVGGIRSARIAVACTISFVGCADGGATTGAAGPFEVRDSAGIEIAESSAPAWAPGEGWRLGDAPVLEIGMAEGPPEYLLSGVASALRTADGTIVLANGGSQEIRFYDAGGRHLRSVGRRGSGPGEFRQLFWISSIRGDTLLAYDFPARRVSALTPEGAFIRSATIDGFEGFPQVLPALRDGSLAVKLRESRSPSETGDGLYSSAEVLLHLSGEGALIDTLAVLPAMEMYRASASIEGGALSTSMPILFGAFTIVTTAGDEVVVSRNDRYELHVYDPATGLERIVRRHIAPRPVTEEILAEEERRSREELESIQSPQGRELQARVRAERPHAETLPFFMRVVADDEGNLWIQNFAAPGEDDVPWTVFAADGRMLGEIDFPERFTVRHIGGDIVTGVARDELDVERVQLYRLVKE